MREKRLAAGPGFQRTPSEVPDLSGRLPHAKGAVRPEASGIYVNSFQSFVPPQRQSHTPALGSAYEDPDVAQSYQMFPPDPPSSGLPLQHVRKPKSSEQMKQDVEEMYKEETKEKGFTSTVK